MNFKNVGLWVWMCLCTVTVTAETTLYRYRVQLRDKSQTTYSLDRPEEFLSQRSIERRARQGLEVDSTDLPVCETYVNMLEEQGGTFVSASKWNNTVLMQTDNEQTAERFLTNPFVMSVRKVWVSPDSVSSRNSDRKKAIDNKWNKMDDEYGMAAQQIRMHCGDSLHRAGFRGEGMEIAVIDAGYYNADAIKIFKKMNILGIRDFVNPESDIYAEQEHGMKVLSCMAANEPHVMVGTAPEAGYWLLRTEDNDSEQPVEEDNWAAAVEFADSIGADIVNTSLGYFSFDDPADNYTYQELDGHTSLMTASASRAADKGMLVVCSAGNAGATTWKKITPPADAVNVLTVGAVDSTRLNASFSSIGNTSDNRIKPDIMSMGVYTAVTDKSGSIVHANGTSFASPVFCGLVACLWQACPWLTVRQLIDIIHQASDRNDHPDNIYGYGITNIWEAYHLALKQKAEDEK